MRIGVIGTGAISGVYLENMIRKYEGLEVKAIASGHLENAVKKAEEYGLKACTTEELIHDPEIDLIVNLTPASVHYEIIKESLAAGKHVYTEKTLADSFAKAEELVDLAKKKGLYLGSAPDTFLGASLQTVRKAVDEGRIGDVNTFAASTNRDNNILLSLFSFLRKPGGGVCFDFAVYYITALVSLFGPVRRTAAFVKAPYLKHTNIISTSPQYGREMDTPNESEVTAILEFESGVTGTFHLNADSNLMEQPFFMVYGTKGILKLSDPNAFGGSVELFENDYGIMKGNAPKGSILLDPVNGYTENERGLGVYEMVQAIQEGRKHRANQDLALHVLEVLEGMLESGKDGQFRVMTTSCERPEAYRG